MSSRLDKIKDILTQAGADGSNLSSVHCVKTLAKKIEDIPKEENKLARTLGTAGHDKTMIDYLIKYKLENPELPIVTMTWWEVCAEEGRYWKGEIREVDIAPYYEADESIYIGEDTIMDYLYLNFDGTDRETEERYDALVKEGKIIKVIGVFINL